MNLGDAAELPERFLDTLAECFERLRKTKGYGLDIRVRQHAMKQRVFKKRATNSNTQRVHHGKVAGGDLAGVVNLWEGDGLRRSVGAPPSPHAPLEGASGGIGKPAGIAILEPIQ